VLFFLRRALGWGCGLHAKNAFNLTRLMLVGAEQAPSAFRFVQLRLLGARVISHFGTEGKERLQFQSVLCLSHLNSRLRISIVQLQRLEPRVISRAGQKVKEQPSVLPVLCLSALGKPPPHFIFYILSIFISLWLDNKNSIMKRIYSTGLPVRRS
jgi:hypothetical protein